MKQRELEIFLQQVPSYSEPIPSLEQYQTPPSIAADMLFIATHFGDIKDKKVVDLGCGTGILSVGAYIMGASEIIGVDVDPACIQIAQDFIRKKKFDIRFIVSNVDDVELHADTVIMNPPFGAQKGNLHADRVFLKKGMEIAPVIYSLHLTKTISFIRNLLSSWGREITYEKKYLFPIQRRFFFHEKEELHEEVTLIRAAPSMRR